MTYASGGLIQATDFNNLNGPMAGSTGTGTQINPIWSTGYGSYGYGQTGIANVAVSDIVYASRWASMVNVLNTARTHQSGSGSGITAITAGSTITYLSTLSSAISTATSSRMNAYALGSTTSSSKTVAFSAASGASRSGTLTWSATFSSADAARYFFNAGGYFTLRYNSFTNTGGTSRGTSIQTLAQTNFSSKRLYGTTYGARAGTGGTVNTDVTAGGFYGLTTTSTSKCQITSSGYYSNDYVIMYAYSDGVTGSYGSGGSKVYLSFLAYSSGTGATGPQDTINVTLGMTLTAQYPSSSYLSNTWGTVTLA